jgi:hypothetical protein
MSRGSGPGRPRPCGEKLHKFHTKTASIKTKQEKAMKNTDNKTDFAILFGAAKLFIDSRPGVSVDEVVEFISGVGAALSSSAKGRVPGQSLVVAPSSVAGEASSNGR